jgi:malate dehydrogenase (oxaloacetate-decarboxylating)
MTALDRNNDAPLFLAEDGSSLLSNPLLNKGTAFTEAERNRFGLHGRLPPGVRTLDEQIARRLEAMRRLPTDLDRYLFLRELQDTNETLFYALLIRNLSEVLPLIYTPTVGDGCQTFSRHWRYPRGLFLSWPQRDRIEEILAHPDFDDVEAIVVSDGERILGLGDQGAGGMGIPIGKLSIYTACAGVRPAATLPVLLDVGTDNAERLADPLYIGWRHERVRGQDYDEFVDRFVRAVKKRWPKALLQWEDFARDNASRLLDRYRDQLLTFNDDIQGTAAVAAGALLSAMQVTGQPLTEQAVVIVGAGSAGCGIGSLLLRIMVEAGLSEAQARSRFFALNSRGLLVEGMSGLAAFQAPFVRTREDVQGWTVEDPERIGLLEVVTHAKPAVLIGVSGQPGVFNEAVVRAMAANVERPVIFPLSNPTSRAEGIPAEILAWTEDRAIVGTGTPFPPVERNGALRPVDQVNNSYIFPGVGLGALAVDARRITDGMMAAAAVALAELSPAARNPSDSLLPPVQDLRETAAAVARAVALQARAEGVCPPFDDTGLTDLIERRRWTPAYRPYEAAPRAQRAAGRR